MRGSIYDNWWIESAVKGLRFKVTVETDELAKLEDKAESLTPENIKAFEDGLWEFVYIEVVPVYEGIRIGECVASMGGTESGFMTSGAERIGKEQLAEYPVADLVKEAAALLHTNKLDVEIMSEHQSAETHEHNAARLEALKGVLRNAEA